jgi:NADPH:quinone reductase-like Zn-dependent oxidoreductase
MKAAIYTRYGPPEVVQIEDVEKPVPNDNGVLIKVRAASVNPYDWHFMRGLPYLIRLMAGFRKPKVTRLGADVSGQVEAVGKNVSQFKPGDEVFGACSGPFSGAFAEYACTPESALVLKPANVTFEQAASVPIAALTALQALRDKAKTQWGHKVLVNGAAGGVGTFGVQIAKSFGAEVTAVCSARNIEMVRSIGADRVIDYAQQDFTKSAQRYDIILDNVGNHSLSACRRVLNPKGILVTAGGQAGSWMLLAIARALTALVLSWFSSRKLLGILAKLNQRDLTFVGELIASGKISPVIDKIYKLTEIRNAIRHVETGHARGKVIIALE